MTENTTLREKGQALFLAALMVMSVFAMSAAFAGAAVASSHVDESYDHSSTELDGALVWSGQTIEVTNLNDSGSDEDVQLRRGDGSSSTLVEQLSTGGDGTVVIDTSDLDADTYFLRGAGADATNSQFELAVQTLDASFADESVAAGGSTDLEIDSNRATYDVEVTAENLNADELAEVFNASGNADVTKTSDGVEISDAEGAHNADFSSVDAGTYNFTVTVTDTDVSAETSVEVRQEVDAEVNFDSSTYSAEAGDVVEFTVEMDGTDTADVRLVEDDENYEANLTVTDGNDDGEVTVRFNTYHAGQNESSDAFSVVSDDDDVTVNDETEFVGDYRLLPADFTLELHHGGEEVDLATLVLHEQKDSIGPATTGVAKHGADVSDAEAIAENAVERENVAMDDIAIVQVEASGIFGYLENNDVNDSGAVQLEIKQTNPDRYQSPNEIDPANVDIVQDPDNKQLFVVIQTSEVDVEAGQEYEVTLTTSEDYNAAYDRDGEQSASSTFSVEERSISIDGVKDKQEHLVVQPSKKATISGQSNAAPGSEVQVRVRSTGKSPFLMTKTVEVDADGQWAAKFDFSGQSEGQEFTIKASDMHDRENVNAETAAKFGSPADEKPDTHTLTVSVVDEDGHAIPGASVTVDGESASTNVKGQAALDLADGEYTVSASADGYEDGDSKVTIDGDDAEVTVTLTAEEDKKGTDDDDSQAGDDDSSADDSDSQDDSDPGAADDDDDTGADGDEDQPGFGVIVALVALLAAAGLALRRQ